MLLRSPVGTAPLSTGADWNGVVGHAAPLWRALAQSLVQLREQHLPCLEVMPPCLIARLTYQNFCCCRPGQCLCCTSALYICIAP